MYYIVSQEVLEKVVDARPFGEGMPTNLVFEVLHVLRAYSMPDDQEMTFDRKIYWRISFKEIVDALATTKGIEVTNRDVGKVISGLGLVKTRRNNGMIVTWSQEQLDILFDYFGLEGAVA